MIYQTSAAERIDHEAYHEPGFRYTQEMGLTPAQFAADLPRAVVGQIKPNRTAGEGFTINNDGCVAEISIEAQENRRIGSLSLPVSRIDIAFYDFTAQQYKAFTEHFNLAFLRMGG